MGEVTEVRVSKTTLEMLERLREQFGAGGLDEVIQMLVRRQRKLMLDEVFGLDKGRIKPFVDENRGEDRR